MPKSETTIRFTPAIGKELLPVIQDNIHTNDFEVSRRIRTADSVGATSTLLEISIVVATSSPACLAIASIIRQWIKTRSSKKITLTTEKGSIQVENLTSDELNKIMKECKEIKFGENE